MRFASRSRVIRSLSVVDETTLKCCRCWDMPDTSGESFPLILDIAKRVPGITINKSMIYSGFALYKKDKHDTSRQS
jgi:hypothetical protein